MPTREMKRASDDIQLTYVIVDSFQYPFRNIYFIKLFFRAMAVVVGILALFLGVISVLLIIEGVNENIVVVIFPTLILISLSPFISYSIQIIQDTITGHDEPPPPSAWKKQVRRVVNFVLLWSFLFFLSTEIINFVTRVLFSEYLDFFRYFMETIALVPLVEGVIRRIVANIRAILLGYVFPAIFATYAQREKLTDLLLLPRFKYIFTDKNYVLVGIISGILWQIGISLSIRTLRFALWIGGHWTGGLFYFIITVTVIVLIAGFGMLWIIAPVYLVSRMIGLTWYAVKLERGDKRHLIDSTTQRSLSYYHHDRPLYYNIFNNIRSYIISDE